MTDMLDILDSEVAEIGKVLAVLKTRASTKKHNYTEFEREIKERFEDIGFVVAVDWYEFGHEGRPGSVAGAAMPEVSIVGRCERKAFDRDRMVHEVTNNLLGIPGEGGVIKADPETYRRFREGNSGHGHGHSH